MATTTTKSTTKKTTTRRAAPKKKVEAQIDLGKTKAQVMQAVEQTREKVDEIMDTPEAKKAVTAVKKGVSLAQKEAKKVAARKDVKKAVTDAKKKTAAAKMSAEKAISDAEQKRREVAAREDVKETVETIQVKGSQLVDKVRELIKAGNVRKIIIKDKNGKSIAEFPLTFGVIGAAALLPLAAVATIAALITECTITVIREQ